jgi:RNA polymerase sigma factor (sigma-70 family)
MELKDMIELIHNGHSGQEKVARILYMDHGLHNGIKKTLSTLGAPEREFQDVFNFTIVQFMKTVLKNPDLKLSLNVNSYLFGIARNIYLQKIRKNKLMTVDLSDDLQQWDTEPLADLIIIDDEKRRVLHEILDQLGVKCKEVLISWASGYKMKEIAKRLNYSSEGAVRRRKFNCMKSLATYFEERPSLIKLFRQ